MIKALKGDLLILGLSEMNISRLQDGFPMSFNLSEVGLPDQQVVIFTGKDEWEMAKYVNSVRVKE